MSQQNGVDKVELTILVGDTKHLQKIINAIRTIDTVRLVSPSFRKYAGDEAR